ncbi:AAA family ATPase [Brachyspira intermedia]|uniref:AAA family ATPase n=1 Tax=Brachyspira intermedia TaxID=84377 RepID=UPI003006DEC6
MSKLIIKNLGPITDFEMDIKDFNLIIGEQAVGKSTICKCIYFFRTLKDDVNAFIAELLLNNDKNNVLSKEELITKLDVKAKDLFIKIFGDLEYTDLFIFYKYKESIDIKIEYDKDKKLIIYYSDTLLDMIYNFYNEIRKIKYNKSEKRDIFSFDFFKRIIPVIINKGIFDEEYKTYYIPAARSSLSFFNNHKTTLDYEAIDFVNFKFIQLIENMQRIFNDGIKGLNNKIINKKMRHNIIQLSNKIINLMKGEYFSENGTEYILLDSEKKEKIPVNYISSGHQEILWLLNILYYLIIRNEKAFVIIEEPEAHLYPKMQKEIVDFIVNFMNITGSTVFITTHSPYILTSTNNLLYAGKIRKEKNNDDVNKKIDKLFGKYGIIDTDKINAFKLYLKDYKTSYSNLINENSGEIMTELIDEISDYINETYTKLIDIEEYL